MKKIIYAAALFAAFTFASCGGNKTADQQQVAADSVSTDAAIADGTIESVADAESLADKITSQLDQELQSENPDPAKVKKLTEQIRQCSETLKNGENAEIAKAYASKVKAYLEQNADKIKSIDPQSVTVLDVVNAAANLPQTVKDAAAEGVDAVKGDGAAAKAASQTVKAAAQQAGQKTVSDAKANAKATTDAAVKKANDKANAAVQKGAAKATDAINKGLKKALGGE